MNNIRWLLLVSSFIITDEKEAGRVRLRDMLLLEYASRLQAQVVNAHIVSHLRLERC